MVTPVAKMLFVCPLYFAIVNAAISAAKKLTPTTDVPPKYGIRLSLSLLILRYFLDFKGVANTLYPQKEPDGSVVFPGL